MGVFRRAVALKPELSEPHLLLADVLTSKGIDRNAGGYMINSPRSGEQPGWDNIAELSQTDFACFESTF